MSQIFLVGGGCRSGKSNFALKLAESLQGPKIFLATAKVYDQEMAERVQRHQQERHTSWQTWEEALHVPERISKAKSGSVFLIDCLTLWVSQMMMAEWPEKKILAAGNCLIDAIRSGDHQAVIVSNEVGMGLVPDNRLGRDFRDLMGWMHQALASHADEVYFTTFGISLPLKRLESLSRGADIPDV
ncbi:MAG: bifunctional adenosylcobinamide kinase/adenosylcobinamide-phosphate guanylyltransferase [Oligoflexus sp.]